MSGIYAGRSAVQIFAEATELSPLQNIQTSSSAHPASNCSFFAGSKVASVDSLTTHICLDARLKSVELYLHSTCLPPWHILGQLLFYLYPLPMYVSLNRSHPFWSYERTLLYITYPLHAHYMTHLFHLHWSNYINIMNSSNNETHYILLCVRVGGT